MPESFDNGKCENQVIIIITKQHVFTLLCVQPGNTKRRDPLEESEFKH